MLFPDVSRYLRLIRVDTAKSVTSLLNEMSRDVNLCRFRMEMSVIFGLLLAFKYVKLVRVETERSVISVLQHALRCVRFGNCKIEMSEIFDTESETFKYVSFMSLETTLSVIQPLLDASRYVRLVRLEMSYMNVLEMFKCVRFVSCDILVSVMSSLYTLSVLIGRRLLIYNKLESLRVELKKLSSLSCMISKV
jgi:hypothetical protein